MRKGLTLIELMIAVVMVAILMGVTVYIFRAVLLSWSGEETRAGIDIGLDSGIEKMLWDLRTASQVYSSNDEIRFTQDQNMYYIYYLYNSSDTYPPSFNQASYQLKKATLSVSGIDIANGTFTYGSGDIITSNVLPPPASNLSQDPNNTNVYIIDLSAKRKGETIESKTQVKPRNIGPGALMFNGNNNYVVVPYSATLTSITLSFWCEYTLAQDGGRVVKVYGTPPGYNSQGWNVNTATDGGMKFCSNANGYREVESGPFKTNDGKWHHYVFTYDGSTFRLYIDANVQPNTILWINNSLTVNYIIFAHDVVDGNNGAFTGQIGPTAIWSRALSSSEISSVYTSGVSSVSSSGLIGYWDFHEQSGTILHDIANGNNGTVTGFPLPTWVSGPNM